MKSIITALHALFQCQFMCLKPNTITRACISLAFTLLFALQLQAQCTTPDFAAAVNYTTGSNPSSVAIGDVNGDGKADLAAANIGSNTVSILLNNGNGTFAAAVNYATGSVPISVAIGDVNGDGKADLAVANYRSNNVSVLLNNGNGTFAAAVNYTMEGDPRSVAIGDLNGDGKADLAVVNEFSDNVSILLNNGNGTFAAAMSYATRDYPYSVAIGDVNGDGKADLAVANFNSNTVSVLLNNGNGTFAAAVDYATGRDPYSVAIGDVNGDGKADLAVANYYSNNISVLLNNGSGTFAAAVNYATGSYSVGVAIGDVNGDGNADLAVANVESNTVSVLLNNGNGTFAAAVNYATGSGPVSVVIGDINGDGKADLAVANNNSNNVSVLLNNCSVSTATAIGSSLNPSCQGTNVTFTATVASGSNTPVTSGGVTFTQGNTILADSIPVDANGKASISTDTLSAGSHTLVATYKTASGFTTSNNSVIQTVNARPTGAISGGGTYCNGSNTTTSLTLTVTGSGTISGTLSDGTSFSGTAPAIQISVSPTATTTYTISSLSDANCTAQSSDLSGNGLVTVNARPSTPVVTVINNCGSSILSTTATGNLLWSTNETTASINVSNAATYTVTQTVNGCTSDPGSGIAAPNAIPSAPVVTVVNNCGSSTLTTNASGSLLWNTNETSSSITVSNAGSYTVTQTVNGCTSAAGSGTATPKTLPSKPVVTANGSTDFCQGGSVTLSAPSGFSGYKWSNNATSQTITVTQSGSYSVVVTNTTGCSSPASDAITVTVGNDTQKPVITCPAAVTLCYDVTETYTIAPLQATDNCGIASVSYTISGATTRSGSGINASGKFSSGTSTVTWTVKDGSGNTSTCQSSVTVNDKFTVAIPDGWALGSGCTLNTVYKGYTPASYILLIAKPTGGKSPYTYKWSNGSTASFILVNPAAATTYTLTVKDAKGCTQSASKQINVVDVRCGSKMDKVTLCYKGTTMCTDQKDVASYLLKGAYLGNCKTAAGKSANEMVQKERQEESNLTIKVSPNPAATFFKLTVNSSNVKDKISISIIDEVGRSVETRTASAGETLQIGDRYHAGVYFAQAIQGNKRVTLKLIKQAW